MNQIEVVPSYNDENLNHTVESVVDIEDDEDDAHVDPSEGTVVSSANDSNVEDESNNSTSIPQNPPQRPVPKRWDSFYNNVHGWLSFSQKKLMTDSKNRRSGDKMKKDRRPTLKQRVVSFKFPRPITLHKGKKSKSIVTATNIGSTNDNASSTIQIIMMNASQTSITDVSETCCDYEDETTTANPAEENDDIIREVVPHSSVSGSGNDGKNDEKGEQALGNSSDKDCQDEETKDDPSKIQQEQQKKQCSIVRSRTVPLIIKDIEVPSFHYTLWKGRSAYQFSIPNSYVPFFEQSAVPIPFPTRPRNNGEGESYENNDDTDEETKVNYIRYETFAPLMTQLYNSLPTIFELVREDDEDFVAFEEENNTSFNWIFQESSTSLCSSVGTVHSGCSNMMTRRRPSTRSLQRYEL